MKWPRSIQKAVLHRFSIYPYNEFVALNTGDIGVVTNVNRANAARPAVQILYSRDGARLDEPKTIDLLQHSQLSINATLTAADLPTLN